VVNLKNKKLIISLLIVCIVIAFLICIPDKLKIHVNQPNDQTFYTELVEINGIGPVTAGRAVVYRRAHKPIKVNDLDNIKGVGEYRLHLIENKFKD
jgi:DNA uptake protein ComE-like DNA-binding protein